MATSSTNLDPNQIAEKKTTEGKKLPVEHCIKGTKGWQIADGLYVEGCKIIDKPNFGWPNWREEHLEEVEIIGLCTDICVVSNALIIKATFPDAHVKVDESCCAGVTPETHEAALRTMEMCQVEVVDTSDDEINDYEAVEIVSTMMTTGIL